MFLNIQTITLDNLITDMLSVIFILITLLSFTLFYIGTGKDKRVFLFYSLWIATVGSLSYVGYFQTTNTIPPRVLIVIIPSILYTVYFYRKLNVMRLKTTYLLSIHILRLPVEITLYQLFLKGKMPIMMTYKGWNFDILIGATAVILFLYIIISGKELNKTIFKIWNSCGLVFLGIIVLTALLSAPSPIQQLAFEQPNVAILEFPYTFLPAIIVPSVLLSHLLCLKANRNQP